MEATSELLQKLQRRRERMGERSPLKDISSNSTITVESRSKDFEAVKVQQRRSLFEGLENQAALGNAKLGKSEEKIQEDRYAAQQIDECKEPHLSEALISCTEDFLVAEDPIESIPSSPNQDFRDIMADVVRPQDLVVASPGKYADSLTTAMPTDLGVAYQPVQGVQDLRICPFPSSNFRINALEASATISEQAIDETNVSRAPSPHGPDVSDRADWGQSFVAGNSSRTSSLGGNHVEQSSLQSEAASARPGRKSTSSRRNSFSTQILKPLQDFAAAFQQSDSCVFNRLSEGDSATPSPSKTSTPPGVRSKNAEQCESGGNSPAWEDGPEPLEYCLLDYHGVLPEGLLEKIKRNVEMHAACMQKLKRENDRLRRLAHQRDVGDEHGEVADKASALEQHQAETRSVSDTRITVNGVVDPKEYSACVRRVASDLSRGGSGGSLRPCRSIPMFGGRMQSEIARTESRVAELEEAIRREGQKLREKDSERRAAAATVAREVEAIRCEARAHRAKLNKHMRDSS